jgi:hypothetical protein
MSYQFHTSFEVGGGTTKLNATERDFDKDHPKRTNDAYFCPSRLTLSLLQKLFKFMSS